jgi:hypothetical protein
MFLSTKKKKKDFLDGLIQSSGYGLHSNWELLLHLNSWKVYYFIPLSYPAALWKPITC